LKDDPLWQKIEHEIRMKEGAAKLLAVNRNPGIALEASKSLLSSTARLNAYMIELEAHKALGVTEGALDRLLIIYYKLFISLSYFCVCEGAS